jgi:hypothetical protein
LEGAAETEHRYGEKNQKKGGITAAFFFSHTA